ncbi:hypothetical protein BC826DRAFT_499936 [Russula brevipes]|nr:hypothetical protein BC826DRAFT_499936 [Russula brevipes]
MLDQTVQTIKLIKTNGERLDKDVKSKYTSFFKCGCRVLVSAYIARSYVRVAARRPRIVFDVLFDAENSFIHTYDEFVEGAARALITSMRTPNHATPAMVGRRGVKQGTNRWQIFLNLYVRQDFSCLWVMVLPSSCERRRRISIMPSRVAVHKKMGVVPVPDRRCRMTELNPG